jgi:isochorismate synthase
MDALLYRFPGGEKEKLLGEFIPFELDVECVNGFIISSFDKQKTYVFKEQSDFVEIDFSFHSSKEIPFVISESAYLKQAVEFIARIKSENIRKAILSRVKKVNLDSSKLIAYFDNLCAKYPNTLVYLASSHHFGTWLGATPEILLKVENNSAETMSLAGTKKSESIEWSKKEIEEQSIVTEYISAVIQSVNTKAINKNGPYTYQAGPVFHLKTDFKFDLPQEKILPLVKILHPTPAIGGLPVENSLKLIRELEQHNRELYTGFLGLISENQSNLFVNLRSCQVIKNEAFLYLGGGFTKDSSPLLEWEETENKSNTLTSVLIP